MKIAALTICAEEYAKALVYESFTVVSDEAIRKVAAQFYAAMADARRAALEEVLKIAEGTMTDGIALAKKAANEGDMDASRHWCGERDGADDVRRDILDLLGIDWANGETEVRP